MKNAALSIAVAIALCASFIYGVSFGREVEHDAELNASYKAAAVSLYYQGFNTPAYTNAPDSTSDGTYYDYTYPEK